MKALWRFFCPWMPCNHQLVHLQGLGRQSHQFPRWRLVRCCSSSSKEPGSFIWPAAKRQARQTVHHGQKLVDHYTWMQAGLTQDVQNYIDQESRMVETLTHETQDFQSWIMRQLEDLENESKTTEMPTVMNGVVYFRRFESDSWHYYRRQTMGNSNTDTAEHILDTASLTELYGYPVVLSTVTISPDQNYMAFVVETSASDTYDAHIFQLGKNGAEFVDRLNNILSVEFAHHGVLYYTRMKGLRAGHVWKHQVGQDVSQDKMILEEPDEKYFVDLSHTKDRRYITINLNSTTTSEVHLLDSLDPDAAASLVCPRQAGVQYFVEHCQGLLYVLTNAGDDNDGEYRLVACPVSEPGNLRSLTSPGCRIIYAPGKTWHIQDMDVFTDHCVLCAMAGTLPRIVVIPADAKKRPTIVEVPREFCQITPGPNATCAAHDFQFSLSSPVHPTTNYCHEIKNTSYLKVILNNSEDGEVKRRSGGSVKRTVGRKICTRLEAVSKDGTLVPITVFHSDNVKPLSGSNPMLVCSYGAYGVRLDMSYNQQTAVLVELGWVVAYCHVRGGGDLGVHWHHAGRALNKIKSFEDLEACLSTLHQAGYSQPTLTALHGISAGGLLVAAVCNRAPQLIKAAVLEVPYVDVLSTMLDPTLPLTQQETEEWGDPLNDPEAFDYIKSYCPYQNIACQDYPSMLVTTSLADTRVPVWIPLKYVAKLRHMMSSSSHVHNSLHLWVHEESGHFGQFGEADISKQVAVQIAFLYTSMGLCMN
ncbi:prolyl endopeptidase-like [Patiria miniata]|uniref:Prolyl endopeptidase n=1 Tax=Patiria miniata TaxID=46514 RepID=A0A914BIS4_PATMI|nr:prolyl endopeptidase-like [Patiria miniata]